MSVALIKQEETVAHQLVGGVIAWSNPRVDLVITSEGDVFYKEDGTKAVPMLSHERYNTNIKTDENNSVPRACSFASLFAYMVLGVQLQTKTVRRIDETKGFFPSNVQIVKPSGLSVYIYDVQFAKEPPLTFVPLSWMPVPTTGYAKQVQNTNLCKEVSLTMFEPKYYSVIPAFEGFRTEDFALFTDLQAAKERQEVIDEAKKLARVALVHGGSKEVSEAIFCAHMSYTGEIPYNKFDAVLSNNDGVVNYTQNEFAVFDRLQENGIKAWATYSLPDSIFGYKCPVAEAQTLQAKLEAYKQARKDYEATQTSLHKIAVDFKLWEFEK